MGTGRLIGLKVMVTSVALLGAWTAIAASVWFFGERLAVWGPGARAAFADYRSDFIPSLSPTAESLATVASVLVNVTTGVACAGAFHALLILSKKGVLLGGLGFALYVTLWVVVGVQGWIAGDVIFTPHLWIVPGAVYVGTIYLFRHGLAERIFTLGGFAGLLVLWAAFALVYAWLNPTGIGEIGQPSEWDEIVTFLLLALMPLAVLALAPWSFSRIRHQ